MKLEQLRACALPITWTTLRVGWDHGLLPTEELQHYAADHLGKHSGEKGEWIFLLFDADPTDRRQIRQYLEALAENETSDSERSQEVAKRTWNVASLLDCLATYYPDDAVPAADEPYALDSAITDLVALCQIAPFRNLCTPPWDRLTVISEMYGPNSRPFAEIYTDVLSQTRRWLVEEADRIRQDALNLPP